MWLGSICARCNVNVLTNGYVPKLNSPVVFRRRPHSTKFNRNSFSSFGDETRRRTRFANKAQYILFARNVRWKFTPATLQRWVHAAGRHLHVMKTTGFYKSSRQSAWGQGYPDLYPWQTPLSVLRVSLRYFLYDLKRLTIFPIDISSKWSHITEQALYHRLWTCIHEDPVQMSVELPDIFTEFTRCLTQYF